MQLHALPIRTAGAAENMALDFLLLQRYPAPAAARFRHYEWRTQAFTFGLSQTMAYVRANLPPGETFDLCRRPTGGGIVDHRNDWTYCLVIPRAHALFDAPATQAYREVHASLAAAMRTLGRPVALQDKRHPSEEGPTVCFDRPELYDVLNTATGAKVAGAAMKRNKHGLLLQGSIEKSRVGAVDWEKFQDEFSAEIARALGADVAAMPWPELNEEEVSGLVEQYSSLEWMENR
ncbi:MAG TPA: lipoate--protein ligase family protein [Lacunisphaera sp.]|nr:lipoate--protein ligase family protein [Lacunisphaera sp.]